MNYEKHYKRLTDRAKNRVLTGYKERHHILPKCMGGGDEPENLVELTAAEHYVAHQLLLKIYPESSGLSFAALTMSKSSVYLKRNNNKQYEWLRKRHSSNISKNQKGKVYYNNGVKSIRLEPGVKPPDGFVKGRHYSPMQGKKGTLGSDSFSRKEIQHMLLKRRWDKDREELCKKFGVGSMEEVRSILLDLKSKQHERYWIKPILEIYPFMGRRRLLSIVNGA